MNNQKGFTLIELIIVIAIIAILAGAIFVAIDPARRLHESRNARRITDVNTILDAIKKYQVDNSGAFYSAISALSDGDFNQIGTATTGCDRTCGTQVTEAPCVNLAAIGNNYMASIPKDPKTGTDAKTAYALSYDLAGTLTVVSCDAEAEGPGGSGTPPSILITR